MSQQGQKGGNIVQWRPSRQDLIAKSTCESELIASSEALQQGENIAIVLAEMTNRSCEIEVSSDNAASPHDPGIEGFRDSVANKTHQCQSTLDASNGPQRYQVHLPANRRNGSR